MECAKVPSGVRKVKKKQVKDELDRIKQAEKKKRRLEKALATSAAICSELEKKKQKKKEEQQRLDEEGAAIAEAVALHVLLGEDSDESCKAILKEEDGFGPWECTNKLDLFMQGRKGALPLDHLPSHSLEGIGWFSDAYGYGCDWNGWNNSGWTVSSRPFGRDIQAPYFDGGWETPGISAGLIAAQAVSALQIADEAPVDTLIFNQMIRE